MGRPTRFKRARQPEHKLERRTVILEAARKLGLRGGVAKVTLGQIADEVGLAKSNVLRYFETREEIYLQVTAEGWREWATRLQARLGGRPRGRAGSATRREVANALVETLVAVPLFCELLGQVAANLELNVSAPVVRTFKLEVTGLIGQLAAALSKAIPGVSEEQGAEILAATILLAGAAWPIAHPPKHLAALYASDPTMTAFCYDFEVELRRLVLMLLSGLAGRELA